MKRETKFPWWGWLGVACLLPVLYALSIFPVALVVEQFNPQFYAEVPDWYKTFYRPLKWAAEEWEGFREVMNWIAERMISL
jgi:hypothetical protein